MSEFQREDRYIVIKRSDLERLRGGQTEGLRQQLSKVYPLLPKRQCAVIESDWPEFEQVWRMIEARAAGNPLPDYDTLAAQRDEGLAREAELQKQVERLRVDAADVNWMVEQRDALQQHLAEAEKLARSLLDEYDEAKQNARQYRPGAVIGLALRFLASPGCADGEKAE
jgi:hypothetical protein